MSFHVGQRVVCVDDSRYARGHGFEVTPVKGSTYTIRDFAEREDGLGVRLIEIVNPEGNYRWRPGLTECTFHIRRFRPVRDTDISIFTNMLVPTKERERV